MWDIESLLLTGETQSVEFKTSFASQDNIIDSLVAILGIAGSDSSIYGSIFGIFIGGLGGLFVGAAINVQAQKHSYQTVPEVAAQEGVATIDPDRFSDFPPGRGCWRGLSPLRLNRCAVV